MKVLAIDDQPEALKQINKAIAGANGPDGRPYEVTALADHQKALSLLDAERFDVVVTDMLMGTAEDEGLSILHELTNKSPITIVLTAYPSIPNCVASMRAGAWDYLEKVPADGGDAYENLLKSLEEACRYRQKHPEAGRSSPDSTWVREHLGELMKEYPGEVVAVLDGQVVGHDKAYRKLVDRVNKEYPVASPMIVSIPDADVEAIE